MMQISIIFLAFVVVSFIDVKVDALYESTPIFCSLMRTYARMESNLTVCAYAEIITPSIDFYENGTAFYYGGYSTSYTIMKGLTDGDDYPEEDKVGIRIDIVRDDANADACQISVNLGANLTFAGDTTVCNDCQYCGDESFRANCSNVMYGRNMKRCEVADSTNVFFPLMARALPQYNTVKAPRQKSMNPPRQRAPLSGPRVMAPRQRAPLSGPRVMAPRQRAQLSGPRVMAPRQRAPVSGPRVMAPRQRGPVSRPQGMMPRAAPVKAPRAMVPRKAPVSAPI